MSDGITIVAIIKCGCGREHLGIEEWQACPMALFPVQIKPWWRDEEFLKNMKEICNVAPDL